MTVAEFKPDRIVADLFPSDQIHVLVFLMFFTPVFLAEDILFPSNLGAGRCLSKVGYRNVGLSTVFPSDGEFPSNQLDICR